MAPTAATRARANKPAAAKAKAAEEAAENKMYEVTEEDGSKKMLTLQQLKNRLRNEAEREVLDAHRSEVIERTATKYKSYNLDYVRRLSEEEKAAKQIEELYAQFPQLRPQTEQQQQQQEDREVAHAPSDYVEAVPGGALEAFRNEPDEPAPEEWKPSYSNYEVDNEMTAPGNE